MSTFLITPSSPAEIDTLDSFYYYVKGRILAVNPERTFGGTVQARDWPMKEVELNCFYLSIDLDLPTKFNKTASQTQPALLFKVSWVWMIQGDNIAQNGQSGNRGNKFRLNYQMVQELRTGHYPGFCNMSQYSVVAGVGGAAIQQVTPYNPPQQLRWSMPKISDKIENTSGIMFGTGVVGINSFAPAILQ